MKAVGYIRVSTERQEISPDAQRHALEQWAASHPDGVELLQIHEDRLSGGVRDFATELVDGVALTRLDLRARPGLLAAIEDVRSLGADCLVAVKRDRILRDAEGMRVVGRLLRPARIYAIGFPMDDSTMGNFVTGVIDLLSESERHLIQDRTEASLAQLRRQGKRTGELRFGEQVDEDGKLQPNPDELEAIELMRVLHREHGWGRRRIAAELQQRFEASDGARFKPRGKRWQPGTVGRVLARDKKDAA